MLAPSVSRKRGRVRYRVRREVRRSGSARSERRSRSGPCPAFGAAMRVLRGMSCFEAPAPKPRRRRYRAVVMVVVVGNALRKLMIGMNAVVYDGSILWLLCQLSAQYLRVGQWRGECRSLRLLVSWWGSANIRCCVIAASEGSFALAPQKLVITHTLYTHLLCTVGDIFWNLKTLLPLIHLDANNTAQ